MNKKILKRKIDFWLYKIKTNYQIKLIFLVFIIFSISSFLIVFLEKVSNDNFANFFDGFWWTIVTISTVGYGDLYPQTVLGRILGMIIIFCGIGVMSVITGSMASYLVERQLKEGKGLNDLKHLENHFIICGWRLGMKELIEDILKVNSDLTSDLIVLINLQPPEIIDNLRGDNTLKGINYIYGDYVEETVLKRANIQKSKQVLILADSSQNLSSEEIDSKTVMTVYTIESLNRNCYTCAEVLDSKFKAHLEMSHCDEIVLSSDYSRIILSNASSASGVSHVLSDIFSPSSENRLIVVDFPDSYIAQTFKDLRNYFFSLDSSILIGMLENAGNIYQYKTEAIRNAQKTPDISKLIKNLNEVKKIKPNEPVINPGNSYIVKGHSKAIIIEPKPV